MLVGSTCGNRAVVCSFSTSSSLAGISFKAKMPSCQTPQDIFLASLEELAYALAGVEQGAVSDDPLAAIRQLLQQDNAGAGGATFCLFLRGGIAVVPGRIVSLAIDE